MIFDQAEFDVRCEWGAQGVTHLAPSSDVIIIVDVLSFSTSVDIATGRGAVVFPYPGQDDSAVAFAAALAAELADSKRTLAGYSLSPQSLLRIPTGARLVLPSPNGATLTLAVGATPTLAGCLRNARAVAHAAQQYGSRIAVIPAGERWRADASLRPAFEDIIGAGAILSHLHENRSPEARLAVAAYQDAQPHLEHRLRQCSSGKELVERGFERDVALASELNVSANVPVWVKGAYVQASPVSGVKGRPTSP
ncbi:MAG TPA: 2-phosphosulfolactate phosphatase [Anaerolineae bacterium]|nr:2-phosphosulfolactate phosphatase [Anaerolineae bacterium]